MQELAHTLFTWLSSQVTDKRRRDSCESITSLGDQGEASLCIEGGERCSAAEAAHRRGSTGRAVRWTQLLRAELRAAPGGFAEGAVPAGLEGILIPETAPEARTADVLERVEELVNRLRGGGDAGHAAAITLVGFMVREGGRGESACCDSANSSRQVPFRAVHLTRSDRPPPKHTRFRASLRTTPPWIAPRFGRPFSPAAGWTPRCTSS